MTVVARAALLAVRRDKTSSKLRTRVTARHQEQVQLPNQLATAAQRLNWKRTERNAICRLNRPACGLPTYKSVEDSRPCVLSYNCHEALLSPFTDDATPLPPSRNTILANLFVTALPLIPHQTDTDAKYRLQSADHRPLPSRTTLRSSSPWNPVAGLSPSTTTTSADIKWTLRSF